MREIVILCDRHDLRGERVDATNDPFKFSIGDDKFELDACLECQAEFGNLIVEYTTAARRPEIAPENVKPHKNQSKRPRSICPYCGAEKSLGTGMKRHIYLAHPDKYEEYIENNPNVKDRNRAGVK